MSSVQKALHVIVIMMTVGSVVPDASSSISGGLRSTTNRPPVSCYCKDVSCLSLSYSNQYFGKGISLKQKDNDCYEACCSVKDDVRDEETMDGLEKTEKTKPEPNPKTKPKPKSKSRSKPHQSMSYTYPEALTQPKATPSQTPLKPSSASGSMSSLAQPKAAPSQTPLNPSSASGRCQCLLDFNDEMCADCGSGSDKCIDKLCTYLCCSLKCRCDDYTEAVCKTCDEGDVGCPGKKCADVCCGVAYQDVEGYAAPSESTTTGTTYIPEGGNSSVPLVTVTAQSLSSSLRFTAALSYGFFAVLVGGAVAGVVISLKQSRNQNHDRSIPLTGDYVLT